MISQMVLFGFGNEVKENITSVSKPRWSKCIKAHLSYPLDKFFSGHYGGCDIARHSLPFSTNSVHGWVMKTWGGSLCALQHSYSAVQCLVSSTSCYSPYTIGGNCFQYASLKYSQKAINRQKNTSARQWRQQRLSLSPSVRFAVPNN